MLLAISLISESLFLIKQSGRLILISWARFVPVTFMRQQISREGLNWGFFWQHNLDAEEIDLQQSLSCWES